MFINPLEILNLSTIEIYSIDNILIKKAKRKLFTEIELSEDHLLSYKGQKINKTDCERFILELDDPEKLEYYYFLAQNLELNDYLISGDNRLFNVFKFESIYQNAGFLAFLNPYFAPNFSRSLQIAFRNNSTNLFLSILKYKTLINQGFISVAYQDLLREIEKRIDEVDSIKETVLRKEKEPELSDVNAWVAKVKANFPSEMLNALNPYFQSQINKIAASINYLHVALDKNYEFLEPSESLLTHLFTLDIDTASKPIYEENLKIIESRIQTKKDENVNSVTIMLYASRVDLIKGLNIHIASRKIPASTIREKAISVISITELNSLPKFADEIRNQVALAYHNLAIQIYNSLDDIINSVAILEYALNIHTTEQRKDDLLKAKNTLLSRKPTVQPSQQIYTAKPVESVKRVTPISTTKKEEWNISGGFVIFLIIVIAIIIGVSSSTSPSSNYSPPNYSTPIKVDTAVTHIDMPTYNPPPVVLPKYNSNTTLVNGELYTNGSMKNGNISGCNSFFPQYDKDLDNRLTITVNSSTDVAVKLIRNQTDDCVRYVYINGGSTYSIRNIPEGTYYLKIAYGKFWGVKNNDKKCQGKFTTSPYYKKGEEILDFSKIYNSNDNSFQIPSYNLSLGVENKSQGDIDYNSNTISDDDFNK